MPKICKSPRAAGKSQELEEYGNKIAMIYVNAEGIPNSNGYKKLVCEAKDLVQKLEHLMETASPKEVATYIASTKYLGIMMLTTCLLRMENTAQEKVGKNRCCINTLTCALRSQTAALMTCVCFFIFRSGLHILYHAWYLLQRPMLKNIEIDLRGTSSLQGRMWSSGEDSQGRKGPELILTLGEIKSRNPKPSALQKAAKQLNLRIFLLAYAAYTSGLAESGLCTGYLHTSFSEDDDDNKERAEEELQKAATKAKSNLWKKVHNLPQEFILQLAIA